MGNIVSMGYGSSPEAPSGPARTDIIQRLSSEDLKRYTEGFRRVCRNDSTSSASSAVDASVGEQETPSGAIGGGHPPLPPPPPVSRNGAPAAPASTQRRNNNAARVGVGGVVSNASVSGEGMSKKLFRSKLLSSFPLIPHSLSDRLFEVLDQEQRGTLSVELVLRGMALLKHGTRDEHEQLLFTIYDLDNTGLVARDVIDRFMDVIYGRKRARHPSSVELLNRIFAGRATLTFDEFRAVVHEKDAKGDALLTAWLELLVDHIGRKEDEAIAVLERQYNPIVIRHRIAEATKFSTNEIAALEKQFHRLFDTKGGASNRIAAEQFMDVLVQHHFPRAVLEQLCTVGTAIKGIVLFDEFCMFLSNVSRGSVKEKCEKLLTLFGWKPSSVDEPTSTEDVATASSVLRSVLSMCESSLRSGETDQEKSSTVEEMHYEEAQTEVNKLDSDGLCCDRLRVLSWANESSAIVQLLHQMSFAACLLFGIKPDSGYLEKRIIVWHWRNAAQSPADPPHADIYRVGDTWNLIATKWWQQWCRFVGMNELNGTPHGALLLPQIPRQATLSETDAQELVHEAARQHAVQGDDSAHSRPGPIANWSLLKTSGSRRLKEKIVIGKDFHLIPTSVYSTLTQWYNGGPDLFRSIVELDNGVRQLELFPLVLRVARVDASNGGVIMSGEEVVERLGRVMTKTVLPLTMVLILFILRAHPDRDLPPKTGGRLLHYKGVHLRYAPVEILSH
ncbi:hypothetical protein PINS_up005074 [Pythium insidiosum]|nr:hypothetical protein PINS_up005074 [Pythium insidiosum]